MLRKSFIQRTEVKRLTIIALFHSINLFSFILRIYHHHHEPANGILALAMRGSSKFCQRGSNFDRVLFLLLSLVVDEERKDPNTNISRPSSACLCWPNIECWLGSFVIFQGIWTSIAKIPYFFFYFSGGGGGQDPLYPPPPPLDLHMLADVSSEARGLNFGLCLKLHPYFVYVSSIGSDKYAHCTGSPGPSLLDNMISTQIS